MKILFFKKSFFLSRYPIKMIATKAAAFISISAMMILLTLFHSIVYYSRNQRCLQYRFRKNTPRQPGGAHISFIHTQKSRQPHGQGGNIGYQHQHNEDCRKVS